MRGVKTALGGAMLVSALAAAGAAFGTHVATKPPPPRAGGWKLIPVGPRGPGGLVSGSFTVSESQVVTSLRAQVLKSPTCSGGTLRLDPTTHPQVVYVQGGGYNKWVVDSVAGVGAATNVQPTAVVYTLGGARRLGSTLSISFPLGQGKGSGSIVWSEGECEVSFGVKRG